MGYNTTVVFYNDEFGSIADDPDFGKKLVKAMQEINLPPKHRSNGGKYGVDVRCPNAGVGTVINTHHADQTSVLAVSKNGADILSESVWPDGGDESRNVRILRALANQMGYDLHKKRNT